MQKPLMNRICRIMVLSFLPSAVFAGKLDCPDFIDNTHRREFSATSAPEIKARISSQESARWREITRPLIRKAIKLAKAKRAAAIEQSIETACKLPEHYVAQLVPYQGKASGCDHRLLTRPADEEHIWVQVVATCRYDWACCTADDLTFPVDTPYDTPEQSTRTGLTPGTTPVTTDLPNRKSK